MTNHADIERVGRLLDRVPGMRDQAKIDRLTLAIEEISPPLRLGRPDSAHQLATNLGDSSAGFAPLLTVVERRPDIFGDDSATRDLRAALVEIVGRDAGAGAHEELTKGAVRSLIAACDRKPIPLNIVWQAYQHTLRFGVGEPAQQMLDWTGHDGFQTCANRLLESDPANGVVYVLDYLEQIAYLLRHDDRAPDVQQRCDKARDIQDRCDKLVEGTGYADRLARVRREVDRREARLEDWLHVLVQLTRDIEVEADAPANAQVFCVTIWRYVDPFADHQPPPAPYQFATMLTTDLVPAERLPDLLQQHCEGAQPERLIVELMAEDLHLPDDLIDELSSRYCLVLRPSREAARPAQWFANWQAALDDVSFKQVMHARLREEGGQVPLIIHGGEGAELFTDLLAVNAPIAVWGRRGGLVIDNATFVSRACAGTPAEFFDDRQQRRIREDAVLMWHNPHWFPRQRALEWRPREN